MDARPPVSPESDRPIRARKVVYYGPGHSGKTENLIALSRILELPAPLEIALPATGTQPAAVFEVVDIPAGQAAGPASGLQLLSVPGHHAQSAAREKLLSMPDGVVFVADSRADRQDANLVSLDEMGALLLEQDLSLRTLPIVIQLNRRDAPDALPLDELRDLLATGDRPLVPACALSGEGVRETLAAMVDLLHAGV